MKILIAILLLIRLIPSLHAQEGYSPVKIDAQITIDGISDEPIWETIEPLPMTMYTPVFDGEKTERSEVRICYDNQFIYASARFYDSDPGGVMATSLVRDVDRGGDFFNILLDTYNDNENFVTFSTTPTGNRLDAQIINDAEGGFSTIWNQSWNSFWDATAVQTDEGWFAETRIPFSSLRFQDVDGKVVFGIIIHRLIGRKNERQIYPAIKPNWEFGAWKASQAQKIIFEGIYQKKPLYITPYALTGFQKENNRVSDQEFELQDDYKIEGGLDIKYGITNNFNLDLSINTDFAQVEADDQQINLTRFSLFFPEKRQFFQERSGIFSFRLGEVDRLFHSRQIGISPEGEPLRMYGGIRLTGRINNWDIGFLDAQIAGNDSIPTENFGVVRIRKRVFNQNSFVGSLLTSTVDADGNYNVNYGLDGSFQIFGPNYFIMKFGQTLNNTHTDFKENGFIYSALERRAVNGLGYRFVAKRIGQEFDPSIGFTRRQNITALSQEVTFGFFQNNSQKLRVITPKITNTLFLTNTNYELESQQSNMGVSFGLKSGTSLELFVNRNYDNLTSPFSLSESVSIPVGEYTFYSYSAFYKMTDGQPLRINLNTEVGRFYDGDRYSFQISPTWVISKHIDISGDYIFNQVEFPQRNQTFRGNIGRVRLNLALNSRLSFNSFWQLDNANEIMKVNLRLRYNFKEGNDLYVVFDQGNSTTSTSDGPALINQSLIVKYTYTFLR